MATPTPLPMVAGTSNGMLEIFKYKMINDLMSSTSGGATAGQSYWNMFMILLVTVLFSCGTDWINKLYWRVHQEWKNRIYMRWLATPLEQIENLKSTDFAYCLRIENLDLLSILIKRFLEPDMMAYKRKGSIGDVDRIYSTEYEFNKMSDLGFVQNHFYISVPKDDRFVCYPISRVGSNPLKHWIFAEVYNRKKWKLYTNSSMQSMIVFLETLKQKYTSAQIKKLFFTHKISGENTITESLKTTKTFKSLFFEQKSKVLSILDEFAKPDVYASRGIAHHLTFLLTGFPGCGKTSFIKALATHLGRSVEQYTLSEKTTKSDMYEKFTTSLSDKILIMEDFDRLSFVVDIMDQKSALAADSKKDKSDEVNTNSSYGSADQAHAHAQFTFGAVQPPLQTEKQVILETLLNNYRNETDAKQKKLALEAYKNELELQSNNVKVDLQFLLTLLDGVMEFPGRILIFTCNHPERLNSALLRPGRIDYLIEFKKANHAVMLDIMNFYFSNESTNKFKLNTKKGKSKCVNLSVCGDKMCTLSECMFDGVASYEFSPADIIAICKKHQSFADALYELKSLKNSNDICCNLLL